MISLKCAYTFHYKASNTIMHWLRKHQMHGIGLRVMSSIKIRDSIIGYERS